MRLVSVATILLAIFSFLAGSFLIVFGTMQWINDLSYLGILGLLPYAPFGGLLVFLALPTAMFGFKQVPRLLAGAPSLLEKTSQENYEDSPLFSNKRIVGLSLVITGADWLILCVFALMAYSPIIPATAACPLGGCRSIFYSLGAWILIGVGLLILAGGVVLIVMSKNGVRTPRQQLLRASMVRL